MLRDQQVLAKGAELAFTPWTDLRELSFQVIAHGLDDFSLGHACVPLDDDQDHLDHPLKFLPAADGPPFS